MGFARQITQRNCWWRLPNPVAGGWTSPREKGREGRGQREAPHGRRGLGSSFPTDTIGKAGVRSTGGARHEGRRDVYPSHRDATVGGVLVAGESSRLPLQLLERTTRNCSRNSANCRTRSGRAVPPKLR